jgi:hypothetical protein
VFTLKVHFLKLCKEEMANVLTSPIHALSFPCHSAKAVCQALWRVSRQFLKAGSLHFSILIILFLFLGVLGFELGALSLLGKLSTT